MISIFFELFLKKVVQNPFSFFAKKGNFPFVNWLKFEKGNEESIIELIQMELDKFWV